MPDQPFPIPEGMTKETVMANWEKYQKALQNPAFNPEEAGEKFTLFKTFNDIRGMNADVVFSTDVDEPDDMSGASLALRLVGATGQGLGALAGPLGAAGGFGFNTIMNAGANAMDASQGRSTEAVPGSGLISSIMGVENPATTGNPILDAGVESTIDGLMGAGVLSKMGVGASRILGKGGFSEYVGKRIDPQFIEDMKNLEGTYGLNIPLVLQEKGIGGTIGKTLGSVVTSSGKEKELSQSIAKGLEDTWRNAFKLNVDDPKITEEVLAGFNSGVDLARQMKNTVGLLPAQRQAVVGMARFNRSRERLLKVRNGHMINFQNSMPSVTIPVTSLRTLTQAKKTLESMNITGDSTLNGIVTSIGNLRDNLVKKTKTKVTDVGIDVSTMEKTKEVGFKQEVTQLLADPTKNKNAPRTILHLIDAIDNKIANLPNVPQTRQNDVADQLLRVRDTLEKDLVTSLTPQQLKLYDKFRATSKEINAAPKQILDHVSSGEVTGFMESVIKDKAIARQLMANNIVTPQEAKSMVGDYLLQKGKKTLENGDEIVDYTAIKKFVEDPANRDGITEILGSNDLQLFRQFANVAANTAVNKPGNGLGRNLLMPLAGVGGSFLIADPAHAATGVMIGITANQFLKNILFNPKIGRSAIDALKMSPNDKNARKAFSLMMSALNGHEAAAIFVDDKGEQIGEEQIVIRNREGGQPIYRPLN